MWAACGTTGITPIVGWCMGPMWGQGGFSGITGFGGKYMIGLDMLFIKDKKQAGGYVQYGRCLYWIWPLLGLACTDHISVAWLCLDTRTEMYIIFSVSE